MPSENGKDEALLRELREISNRHSRYNQSKEPQRPLSAASSPAADEKENTENGATPDREGRDFLRRTRENPALNQYWYSEGTARALLGGVREALALSPRGGARVAFLSTPSLYFALDPEERARGALFDFDASWESCAGFHFYDYNDPTNVNDGCRGAFDVIIMDPPFISPAVWEKYATTARLLARDDGVRTIATTVDENAALMKRLFGGTPTVFRPSIPHLVYQYSVFTNFAACTLSAKNPELVEETATPQRE